MSRKHNLLEKVEKRQAQFNARLEAMKTFIRTNPFFSNFDLQFFAGNFQFYDADLEFRFKDSTPRVIATGRDCESSFLPSDRNACVQFLVDSRYWSATDAAEAVSKEVKGSK